MPTKPPQEVGASAANAAEADAFWSRMFRLLAELDQLHIQIQRVLDIQPSEARALLAVWNANGLSAGILAKHIKLTAPATTALIDRLESRGLVERAKLASNKRYVIVTVTPVAHERLATIGAYLESRLERATVSAPRTAQQASRGVEPLRRLLDETIAIMRGTPVEVFPASLDRLGGSSIRAFQNTDET